MVLGLDETLLRTVSLGALAVAVLLAGYVLTRYSDDEDGLVAGLRERFVFGIPWGTIIVIVTVYAFYYLVQGGGEDGGPIVAGFRSWSLWYPQSMLFSSFAHSSEAHLMGNLFGTVAFASIAEYAWRHYPDERTNTGVELGERSIRLPRNPYARIGVFVLAVFLVGLLGAVIVPGAVIGFSGVVFAFAGFAIVTFPVATVFAILAIPIVRLLYRSVQDPIVVTAAQERLVRPGWVDVAVQGHLYGLLVGVLLGAALVSYRDQSPNLRHVFFAALVFSVSRSLQSIYWFLGNERFVLFQAAGAAGVFLLVTLIVLTAFDKRRMLVSRIDLSVSTAGAGLLLSVVLALALLGIPYNLVPVSGGEELDNGIEVEDYTVTYAENVEDRYISSLSLPVYQGPSVSMSGVIVASEDRNIWERTVSKQELASRGSVTIPVGDATWRETVTIDRTAWDVAGGNSTYKVSGEHDNVRQELFAADPAIADSLVNGSRVVINPTTEFYEIVVIEADGVRSVDGDLIIESEAQLGDAPIPREDGNVTVADITFERDGDDLRAIHERTEFLLAEFDD